MSAPPFAVDDYDDDDGFDWEAAVREIDNACALASASAPAPARAPVQHPPPPRPPEPSASAPLHRSPAAAGGGARQSTLDRFVDSFTRRQREKERPTLAPEAAAVGAGLAPAGGGWRHGVRAGEGCSRQADEKAVGDRFVESFTRRQREKERAAPAVAVAPAGGRGRAAVRAGKGCSRQAGEEVAYEPCAVGLDHEAVQMWIYPKVREYQKYMVEKALFTNTLVALPTGLGKTFIAAVVMYNYFRWFPEGKIVFTAPSRPLVTQQIEACHNTVGIPQEWTIDMKGDSRPSDRSSLWKSKRVFFVTPQILENDIQSGICMVKQIVCLVIDEAHRASGNHSYCIAVRKLVEAHVPLRILALTATPGSKHANIQNVINNLCISELVHCDEEDSEVCQYVKKREVELLKIPFGSDATQVDGMLLDIMRPHLNRLRDAGVIDYRDYANWGTYSLLNYKEKFMEAPPPNISEVERGEIQKSFIALCSLCHIRKLLLSHGINQAYQFIEDKLKKGSLSLMRKNELFWQAKEKMKLVSSQGSILKIKNLIDVMVAHFNKNDSKDSRVIIFSHFRGSVNEIYCSLQSIDDRLIRPVEFIGQSSAGKRLKGQTQKTQQAILQKFRSGEYNVLVATSIGEEGLDIIEVDLVICFDANISPLRMIQRMGRTGRKHEGRVVVLACEGQELMGYIKKQRDSQTMRKLLRNSERFEYHASPRMVPHVCKPKVKYVKLTIEKYISCLKKMKVGIKDTSPILGKMSEEDGQLIARYFGACKEDVWRPSLVAFPRSQLCPSVVHKVPHSFRTTDMLTDAMQQLQDPSFFRTKCESPLQEPADVAAVKCQAREGLYAVNGNKEAMPQECDGVEASSREVVCNQSFSVPGSPVKTFPIHSFFSGDYVTVDRGGYVSVTFVPVLPQTSAFHKDAKNAHWCHRVQKTAIPYQSAADISRPTVDFHHPAYVTDSGKHLFKNSVSNVDPHSPEFAGQCDDTDNNVLTTPPSKTLTSPREKWGTPCNAKLASSAFSGQKDMELSPRLTHYMEEGIVPESPIVDVCHLQIETDRAVSTGFVPKFGSSKTHDEGAHANSAGCRKGPLRFEKNDEQLSGSLRQNVLDRTKAKTGEPVCPSNVKICTPTTCTPTTNLLCDSFSNDCQLRSGGNTSGSVQQAPKYRRLCKYGDKIKRVSSISLDDCHDGFGECDIATKTMPNQIELAMGKKGKAKRRLDTYIDEEVEVSEDADVSEDEDDDQSEDKYEDSFIDDQTTPTGEFTQTEQGAENNGDMMGFYRRSLLTQSPVVRPSRYLDVSDNSASRTGSVSCSSENLHNSIETPKGLAQTRSTIDPSPSRYERSSLGRASFGKEQSEATIVNCESSTKLDCRKRKLSFQQPASIPVINLEPEPAPEPSSLLATGVNDDIYLDDAFFENLDLDAIEAQATELWRQKTVQSTDKPVETKKASEISFAPPSFDLGF
ncbi:DEAD-box ATP-dependent RNA helicase FANCM isoform X2 [Phragmites australis]|uniref:DEAD-box ATP-dependent RNA helicase FANCM isoform X2 n=1 Tax=Phragmites australis TaxID=29695 RepID=UPI002D77A8D9|nr:DEAD-box ATP-dependent RNA helicase FANCM isoform X2 [Phragmites australis]